MGFYTEKWMIGNINKDKIIIIKKNKNNLNLEELTRNLDSKTQEVIAEDLFKEYDMALDIPNNIYVLYQNLEKHLILKVFTSDKSQEIILTPSPIGEVIDLNIKAINKNLHIIYITKNLKEKSYIINHHYYDGSNWYDFIIEEITTEEVLNPIKVLQRDEDISIIYYKNKEEIKLKKFTSFDKHWGSEIPLIYSKNNKLFLDSIIIEDVLHLVYCEYIETNMVVKYARFQYKEGDANNIQEQIISNEGSPSYPNLIYFNKDLWITWVELNKIYSRYSKDQGVNWHNLYSWDHKEFLRYKYISLIRDDNVVLDYSFGSIKQVIKLLGFGPTNNAKEVPVKKKQMLKIPKI